MEWYTGTDRRIIRKKLNEPKLKKKKLAIYLVRDSDLIFRKGLIQLLQLEPSSTEIL